LSKKKKYSVFRYKKFLVIFKNKYRAIIFDFDGVIVESENMHKKCLLKILDVLNIKDINLEKYKGYSEESFFMSIKSNYNIKYSLKELIFKKQALFNKCLPELKLVNGFKEFFSYFEIKQIRRAIVSSSNKNIIKYITNKYGLSFDTIISSESTSLHKPNPRPYNLAINKLDLNPDYCIAIEDTLVGGKSAIACGCKTILLGFNSIPKEIDSHLLSYAPDYKALMRYL
jgi:beta-phosphoglucomutase